MDTIKTIAITGKGGTGKTMIATLLIKQLVENYKDKRVLAIDADSAMSLLLWPNGFCVISSRP